MSLLRLPAAVRLKIYAYSGAPSIGTPHTCVERADQDPEDDAFSFFNWLIGDCVISRYRELSHIIKVNLNHRSPISHPPSHYSATLSLLLTCSMVYIELARHIYSHCQIVIRAKDDASLAALSRLRASSVHALRRLTIDLNATSCGSGWMCDDEADPGLDAHFEGRERLVEPEAIEEHAATRLAHERTCETQRSESQENGGQLSTLSILNYSQSRPLTITNELHQAVLRNWSQVWAEFRAQLAPATLELDFMCDVADIETGELALKPFLTETQPYMAKCNIRLARRKIEVLQQLAQLAIEHIVCPSTLCSPLPEARRCNNSITFMDLPSEIRQHILGYTDLVVPGKEVEWSPHRGWYLRRGGEEFNGTDHKALLHFHPIAKDQSETIDDAHNYREQDHNRAYCQEKLGGRGCFCKIRHTVSSSYSKVGCWAPPTPFFLVNSILRQDALQVFFSQNRIVVWPTKSTWFVETVLHSPSRLHISTFLSDVVPKDALRHLRYLEVVFEYFDYPGHLTWCPTSSPELIDWKRTIEEIKPHLASSSLAVKIVFPPEPSFADVELPDELQTSVAFSKAEFQHRKTCYFNTILPLQRLACHLKHLWVWIYGNVEEPGGGTGYTADWSRELETTIMGHAYEPPRRSDYSSDGPPVPLLLRNGRWFTDRKYFS